MNYSRPEFNILLKDKENLRCFDCSRPRAEWASVNNGIYLCIDCSGNHRGFGVDISYMKSIVLDKWTDNQIAMMQHGGNSNLRQFLSLYGINASNVIKEKLYKSVVMDYYRKCLKAKSENKDCGIYTPPNKEEALNPNNFININEVYDNSSNKFKSVGANGEVNINMENDETIGNKVSGWMNNALDATKGIANKISDMKIGEKIYQTGSNVANTVIEKGTQITVKNYYLLYNYNLYSIAK